MRVELIGKKLLDVRATKFTGRQTDAVQHNKRRNGAIGPCILIG